MNVRSLCALASLVATLVAPAYASAQTRTAPSVTPASRAPRPIGHLVRLTRVGPRGQVRHVWAGIRRGGNAVVVVPGVTSEELAMGNRIAYPPHRDGSAATFLGDVRAGVQGSRQIDHALRVQYREHTSTRDHATWARYVRTRNEGLDHSGERNMHVNAFQSYVGAARDFVAHHPAYAGRHLPAPAALRAELTRAAGGAPVRDVWLDRLDTTYSALADSAARIR